MIAVRQLQPEDALGVAPLQQPVTPTLRFNPLAEGPAEHRLVGERAPDLINRGFTQPVVCVQEQQHLAVGRLGAGMQLQGAAGRAGQYAGLVRQGDIAGRVAAAAIHDDDLIGGRSPSGLNGRPDRGGFVDGRNDHRDTHDSQSDAEVPTAAPALYVGRRR